MLRLTLLCLVGFTVIASAGCSSDRDERARYDERQQLRQQGQADSNRAADQGRSDLDRATAPK